MEFVDKNDRASIIGATIVALQQHLQWVRGASTPDDEGEAQLLLQEEKDVAGLLHYWLGEYSKETGKPFLEYPVK